MSKKMADAAMNTAFSLMVGPWSRQQRLLILAHVIALELSVLDINDRRAAIEGIADHALRLASKVAAYEASR